MNHVIYNYSTCAQIKLRINTSFWFKKKNSETVFYKVLPTIYTLLLVNAYAFCDSCLTLIVQFAFWFYFRAHSGPWFVCCTEADWTHGVGHLLSLSRVGCNLRPERWSAARSRMERSGVGSFAIKLRASGGNEEIRAAPTIALNIHRQPCRAQLKMNGPRPRDYMALFMFAKTRRARAPHQNCSCQLEPGRRWWATFITTDSEQQLPNCV